MSWLLDALLASALLMAAVLLARAPIRRAFGPRVAYALWALPALRLLLPPLPAGWWRQPVAVPIRQASETITVYLPAELANSTSPSIGLLLACVWAVGAVGFLAFHLLRHLRFCRAVKRGATPLDTVEGVTVIASAAAPGPIAFGLGRRFVAFPADFTERYDADERALALLHELGHHARRDLHANWAALAVLALHWPNPLAWRAFHAFRADQELANDARVLAASAPGSAHAYGRAIVKAAAPGGLGSRVSAACHLHTISDLKGRLRMLATNTASRRRLATGSAAVTLLVAGGLGLTASSGAAERISATLDLPVSSIAQTAPADAGPDARPAPAGPTGPSSGGRHVETVRDGRTVHVVVTKDGKTEHYEGEAADRYIREHDLPTPPTPPSAPGVAVAPTTPLVTVRPFPRGRDGEAIRIVVPDVQNAICPGDGTRPAVENWTENGRQRIIVCTNRFEAMGRDAERIAQDSVGIQRSAMSGALASLQRARTSIVGERALSDEQRRLALAGIDQAIAEMRSDVD